MVGIKERLQLGLLSRKPLFLPICTPAYGTPLPGKLPLVLVESLEEALELSPLAFKFPESIGQFEPLPDLDT